MGTHGIPWCPMGGRGAPYGKFGTVPREPTVSRGMFFFPVGSREYPRDPTASRGIPRYLMRKKSTQEFPLQPKVLDTYTRGNLRLMMGLSSRRTCRWGPWDPMGRITGTPVGPRWKFRGNSRGNSPFAMGSHGIPWELLGLPLYAVGSRGTSYRFPWEYHGLSWESLGFP